MGGARASWNGEWTEALNSIDSEFQGIGFKGLKAVGMGIDDYDAMDGVVFPTGSENSVRACSFSHFQGVIEKAKIRAEKNGISNGVEHDLADLIDEVTADLLAFGCGEVSTPLLVAGAYASLQVL